MDAESKVSIVTVTYMDSLTMMNVFFDIFIGDKDLYETEAADYQTTCILLKKNAIIYGLPSTPELLSSEQQEILNDLHKSPTKLSFISPKPLRAGRLNIILNPAPGLAKTRQNFISLCTGEKGPSKLAPNKMLHYLNCPIHRIIPGFIAQGGDLIRGDGSGGESIYGQKFPCEKSGLQISPKFGSLGMANSGGKNPPSSSQFFFVLSNDENRLSKLKGKYVIFGQVEDGSESLDVLSRLNAVPSQDERPTIPVWIGGCGTYS